jgi:hypothetical protein
MNARLMAILMVIGCLGAPAWAQVDPGLILEVQRRAEAGEVEAQFNLGLMHLHGEGVEDDPVAGANWLLRAANRGHNGASYTVALLYLQGHGVAEDWIEAHAWMSVALQGGLDIAAHHLPHVERRMEPEQIEEAGRRAVERLRRIRAESERPDDVPADSE